MRVIASHREWEVRDVSGLEEVLAWRDASGGAQFWLSQEGEEYPVLAIRVTGELADVLFFPEQGHPGFRSLGGKEMPKNGSTVFVFDGCDPATGEETPNEFVIPLNKVNSIATEFLQRKRMSEAVSWFEL